MIELTKKQALDILMLLTALESWSFSIKETLPDCLLEKIERNCELISNKVIN